MGKKVTRTLLSLLYIVTLSFISALTVYAEESKDNQNSGGFSYEVILPENQHNSKVGYFDLRVTPGQKQTLQIKLKNSADKETTVSVSVNGAKTNSNGVIEYGENKMKKDASLKYDLKDIVTGPKEVTLAPQSEKMLDLEVAVPEASFEGYISGAVSLSEKDQENTDTKSDSGMIKNKFVYQTGIQLSESETKKIKPELKLNQVYPELNNYRNSIFINFSNVKPIYISDMTVDVQIMGKASDEVLYDTKKAHMKMAPNTLINFPVSMNGEKMVPGDYRAKILVTTKAGGRWQWEQEFKITDEDADKFNEQDLTLVQETGINWLLIAMIVGGSLALILIVFIVIRSLKKGSKKKNAKRKVSSTKKRKKN
ncbi:DUF916 and DUF3324 domain-containing protein [Candidatus Enterococcus mansonii]|uniref:Uncharacterized protein n=1 Tax=Candidatus Enterococcus mansonii TaxID=1834181 RepID=A0A242CC88_9ENTE|nr:DUF916 and DUF3324 domain-containing protein [Enterococcus sp. 4G2_DIV0659]OTO07779.1 hypothetical protein A5880_002049 [Enterococcus sp. 4G2_DIV0659]